MSSNANPKLTFWYEFASPYAFLAAIKLARLYRNQELNQLNLELKPINLLKIFQASGMTAPPVLTQNNKRMYMRNDLIRQAKKLDLDIQFQKQFPLPSAKAALISQYLIENFDLDAQLSFLEAIYLAGFVNNLPINDNATLKSILDGLQLTTPSDQILESSVNDEKYKLQIDKNSEAAIQLNMFGAPNFTVNDNPEFFWGQDRLEEAIQTALSINN